MAQNQPLARHSIDKAREDAIAAVQDLRGTISEARQVSKEMGDLLAKMRQERELWNKFFNEGIQEQISARVTKEMKRLENEVTALIEHTDGKIKKRFTGLERSLIATLMQNPAILAVGREHALQQVRPLRPPAGTGKINRAGFHLPNKDDDDERT